MFTDLLEIKKVCTEQMTGQNEWEHKVLVVDFEATQIALLVRTLFLFFYSSILEDVSTR